MLIFIDESGDAGFRLDRGSTPIFAAAMVIFRDRAEADRAADAIRQALVDLRVSPEFKFSGCRNDARDGFFDVVKPFDFRVRALIVDKTVVRSPKARAGKEAFYRFFVRAMIGQGKDTLANAKVLIDRSGDYEFQNDLKRAIRSSAPRGAIRQVQLKNSRRDPLIQLADMCVGAITRSYRDDRSKRDRWRNMLSNKIDDIWDFR